MSIHEGPDQFVSRRQPLINVHFDVEDETWAVNCLSCWGTGDIPQYVGQSSTEDGAWELAACHRHTGDLGTEMRPANPMAWILCATCTCCFSVWPYYGKALGGGVTYSRRVLELTTADAVQVRVAHEVDDACDACRSLIDREAGVVGSQELDWLLR